MKTASVLRASVCPVQYSFVEFDEGEEMMRAEELAPISVSYQQHD
jgi:hypothetical protein